MNKNFTQFLTHPVFQKVKIIANKQNQETYVIGGYVRDLILNRPNKDIDFVVIGNGIDLATQTAESIDKKLKVNVFKNFGTAMFRHNDCEIEFVGASKESYRSDSRKPIVENGSLEDDQLRRDFTINALAISMNKDNFGMLLDPFNGLQDIENKIIRTPLNPELTFSDDPLRMLRAIRFASQLDFTIEKTALKAIEKNVQRLSIISKERITDEFNKILLSPKPSIGLKLLFDTGVLKFIFPELVDLKGVDYVGSKGHKDNFVHTLEVVDKISQRTDDLWLRWAALLHDIGKPKTKRFDKTIGWTFHSHETVGSNMVFKIFKNFKLPLNEKLKYVQKLVFLHLRPIILADEIVTDSAIRRLLFEAGDDVDDLMLLCEADVTSKNQEKVRRYMMNFQIVRQKLIEIEEKDHIRNWQPPISGELIMETFGLTPSREVGIIKNNIKEAILEGKLTSDFQSAFQFMLDEGKKLGLSSIKKNL